MIEITVDDLFNELTELTDDPFGQLKELVHGHDLPLRAAEYGYFGEHYGVAGTTPAIIIASRANDIKANRATVEITAGNDKYEWPLHKLYVRRDEVEEIIMRDKDTSFFMLDAEGNLAMRPTSEQKAQQSPQKPDAKKSPQDSLPAFLKMDNLMPEEVTIEITANGRLKIEARDKKDNVSFSDMELRNINTNELNNQGELLLEMMHGEQIKPTKQNTSSVSALRKILRKKLGLNEKVDPFSPKKLGWTPRFNLVDGTKKAGERERNRDLFSKSNGAKIIDPGDPDRGDYDDADKWLEDNS